MAQGKAPRIPQDHSLATYDPPCDEKVAALNWNQPGRQVFNFIRGCDPQPGATTTFRGEQVKLYNASFLMDDHTAQPGEILEVTDKGIKVAVSGAALLITRFRTKDLGKVKAPEFIEARKTPARRPVRGAGGHALLLTVSLRKRFANQIRWTGPGLGLPWGQIICVPKS